MKYKNIIVVTVPYSNEPIYYCEFCGEQITEDEFKDHKCAKKNWLTILKYKFLLWITSKIK
jgi:hypothetical protein